jgi:hypothetical protein
VNDTELEPFRGVVALDLHHRAARQRHLVNLKANQSDESLDGRSDDAASHKHSPPG